MKVHTCRGASHADLAGHSDNFLFYSKYNGVNAHQLVTEHDTPECFAAVCR